MDMELLKDISAVLGVILSATSVAALLSKNVRAGLSSLVRRYSHASETAQAIADLKTLFEQHLEDDREFKAQSRAMNDILIAFMTTQCRDIIKTMFYKYNDTKVLPLYEKKTLMNVQELYIGKLHCNSYASMLLKEMEKWEIDYSAQVAEE